MKISRQRVFKVREGVAAEGKKREKRRFGEGRKLESGILAFIPV